MQRRNPRPEQLHLELQYDYLKWLKNTGEATNSYEALTAKFFNTPPLLISSGDNLYWKEITDLRI